MGEVVLLPPTSLSNAVKKGGEVLDSWLNHQTLLSIPRQYLPPQDNRLPWNKSFAGMPDNNGPSIGRIFYIAQPKNTVGTEVHTRTTKELAHVSKGALKYKISPHVEMMAQPRKAHPPDVNEPWKLKNKKGYKCPQRLLQISAPRKAYPSTDRPASEIGRPPRAAVYGSPPVRSTKSAGSRPPPPPPPPQRQPSAPTTTTSSSSPTTTTSSTGATASSTGATASSTGATASSSTGGTASSTSASEPTTTSSDAPAPEAGGDAEPVAPADG